ncbi:MAG: phosphoribosylformylglycinamidine cyclo-ligase [Thermomicrobiales bacterium]
MTADGRQSSKSGVRYRDAGVDIDVATSALERIKVHTRSTLGDGAASPIGHFGGAYLIPSGPDQLLVASADGIGTKIKLAFVLEGNAHARVGADLVNHCVNDLLACGARPLFFLDYIAMGKLDPAALDLLVGGMAAACRENSVALIGGETAEMPGLYADGEYDAAGFIVGAVAPDRYLDGSRVVAGDVLIGLPSTGLHTNGYSLARHILGLSSDADVDRAILSQPLPGADETLGASLLQPHVTYLPAVLPLIGQGLVHGVAHITGGGLIDNVPRMLPDGLVARIDPTAWPVPPIFRFLVESGSIPVAERYHAFNMGIGLVLAVAKDQTNEVLNRLLDGREIGVVANRSLEGEPVVQGLFHGESKDG